MTTQLSQISTVSGIEKLNSTLEKLLGAYSSTNTMQAAAMIGKTVLTAGSNLPLSDYGAVGGVELEGAADKVTVNILDATGKAVRTQQLGAKSAGTVNFVWDGKSDAGEAMPNGKYTFGVTATQGSNKVTATALEAGTVNAVTLAKDNVQLQIGDKSNATYSDIKQILN